MAAGCSGGVNDITQKFLDSGEMFGLQFNEGVVFLEVLNWEQVKYAPHSQFSEVPANSGTGFQQLQDSNNNDILYTDQRKKKVKHVAIGHSPSIFRRYTNYPEDENRLRKIENLSSPTAGDDYGYVDGEDSPYSSPTDVEELYIPPNNHLNFNFYNADNEAHTPILNILMRQYSVRPLNVNNAQDRDAINQISRPGSPMPIVTAGSPDRQVQYDLAEFWGVQPVPTKNVIGPGGVR